MVKLGIRFEGCSTAYNAGSNDDSAILWRYWSVLHVGINSMIKSCRLGIEDKMLPIKIEFGSKNKPLPNHSWLY
jgi:hypothetical protein